MFEQLVFALDDRLYQEFKKAVQTGYWGSGAALSTKQKQICQQVILMRESAATTPAYVH